jgi:hypothetical protein
MYFLKKTALGYILGDFLTNESCHPACAINIVVKQDVIFLAACTIEDLT